MFWAIKTYFSKVFLFVSLWRAYDGLYFTINYAMNFKALIFVDLIIK